MLTVNLLPAHCISPSQADKQPRNTAITPTLTAILAVQSTYGSANNAPSVMLSNEQIARGVARCVERAATGGWASTGTGRGCSHEYGPDCG